MASASSTASAAQNSATNTIFETARASIWSERIAAKLKGAPDPSAAALLSSRRFHRQVYWREI